MHLRRYVGPVALGPHFDFQNIAAYDVTKAM
jgi:hypothetical protein